MEAFILPVSKNYLLINPNEDGDNPISWLTETDVTDISQLMRDNGIEKFLDKMPTEVDPNYWPVGEALLLEAKILKIKAVEVVQKWEIENE